jgi:hypothetical protein
MTLSDRLRERIPDESGFLEARGYSEAAIKQGTWLTTSLWNDYEWKKPVKASGLEWQDFMAAFRFVQYDFIKWQRGNMAWEDVLEQFIQELESRQQTA